MTPLPPNRPFFHARCRRPVRPAGVLLLVPLLLHLWGTGLSYAQRADGRTGLGAQVGRPSGLTAKWYARPDRAYAAAIGWNLRNAVFVAAHRLHEEPLPRSPLHVVFGPGLFAGSDDPPGSSDTTLGISGTLGLNFFKERFEVFLQATPRMQLVPATQTRLGGSVGLRYML